MVSNNSPNKALPIFCISHPSFAYPKPQTHKPTALLLVCELCDANLPRPIHTPTHSQPAGAKDIKPALIFRKILLLTNIQHSLNAAMLQQQPIPVHPRGNTAPDMATHSAAGTAELARKQFTVLLVEDDTCTRTLVASLLGKCNYKGEPVRGHACPA